MVYKYNIFCKINFVNGVENTKRETCSKQMLVVVKSCAVKPKKTVPYISAHTRRNSLKRSPSYQSSPPPSLGQLFLILPSVPYTHTHSPIASPNLCPNEGSEERGEIHYFKAILVYSYPG